MQFRKLENEYAKLHNKLTLQMRLKFQVFTRSIQSVFFETDTI